MDTNYKPSLVSCFWRRADSVFGRSVQFFFRLWRVQGAVGWVTRYVCVPKFVFWKARSEAGARSFEFHFWRLRVGAKIITR